MTDRKLALIAILSVLTGFGVGHSDTIYNEYLGPDQKDIAGEKKYRISQKDGYDIVVISVDTLRSDHLTCYGYRRNLTPNMCNSHNKYKQPTIFKNTYAQASWSLQSFTSMMTGKWPFNHGVTSSRRSIPRSVVLLQENLTQAGYKTGGYVDGGMLRPYSGFDDGFENYSDVRPTTNQIGNNRKLFNHGLSFLNSTDSKSFLFLNSMEVHAPYRPKNLTLFEKFAPENLNSTIDVRNETLEDQNDYRNENLTEKELEHIIAGYDTSIRETDKEVGRFMDKLDERGKLNDTIVIITSDHGESFQEHVQWVSHGENLYEEFIKVPLIIYHPDIEGKTVESRVRLIDIAPTIADFSIINSSRFSSDGKSLKPLMEEGDGEDRKVYSSTYGAQGDRWNKTTIIKDNWKLLWNRDLGTLELYNLEEDPGERNDLSSNKPDKVEELRRELLEMRKTEKKKNNEEGEEVSESIKDRLKKLGYRQ